MEIKDLAGLSAGIEKLIDTVSTGAGTLWAHFMSDSIAEGRARALLIEGRAQDERRLSEAWVNKAIEKMGEDMTALMPFTQARALGEISPAAERFLDGIVEQQQRQLRNVGAITAKAAVALPEEGVSKEPVDPDWSSKFFSSAKDVSTEEMQSLWAAVLAREVAAPGSVSAKAVDIMRNMTRADAHLLIRAAQHSIFTIDPQAPALGLPLQITSFNIAGLATNHLRMLEHIGLISMSALIRTARGDGPVSIVSAGHIIQFTSQEREQASFSYYPFTPSAHQLLSVIKFDKMVKKEYAEWLSKIINNVGEVRVVPLSS